MLSAVLSESVECLIGILKSGDAGTRCCRDGILERISSS